MTIWNRDPGHFSENVDVKPCFTLKKNKTLTPDKNIFFEDLICFSATIQLLHTTQRHVLYPLVF